MPAGDKIVIGEVALERVLAMFSSLDPGSESFVVVTDRQGQWLAASRDNPTGRFINYAALPTFQAIVAGRPLPEYEVLDGIMQMYMEDNRSSAEILAAGYPRDAVDRVVRLMRINEYKRRQAPVGIRVTQRAFGRDWRYPITSKFRD